MQRLGTTRSLQPKSENLRVRLIDPRGVWSIKIPMRPWKYRAAMADRAAVIAQLSEQSPFAALWRGTPSAGRLEWCFGSAATLMSTESELEIGGWGLFFFGEDPGQLPPLSGLPTKAEQLLDLLQELRSSAVVVSWYDDSEWLVAAPRLLA